MLKRQSNQLIINFALQCVVISVWQKSYSLFFMITICNTLESMTPQISVKYIADWTLSFGCPVQWKFLHVKVVVQSQRQEIADSCY